jgi:hypothetical protein
MAFGQPSGPPATARQLRDLTALLEAAGHTGFRDARGPLGLTQRQGGGRFTQDEATALIARLEAEAEDGVPSATSDGTGDGSSDGTGDGSGGRTGGGTGVTGHRSPARPVTPVAPRRGAAGKESLAAQLQRVPEDLLVDELRRRGWAVIPPSLAN